jgi:hypothetical protein
MRRIAGSRVDGHPRECPDRTRSKPVEKPRNDDSNEENPDLDTPGGNDPEPVEDRPNVGTTRPEAYPERDRRDGAP